MDCEDTEIISFTASLLSPHLLGIPFPIPWFTECVPSARGSSGEAPGAQGCAVLLQHGGS